MLLRKLFADMQTNWFLKIKKKNKNTQIDQKKIIHFLTHGILYKKKTQIHTYTHKFRAEQTDYDNYDSYRL